MVGDKKSTSKKSKKIKQKLNKVKKVTQKKSQKKKTLCKGWGGVPAGGYRGGGPIKKWGKFFLFYFFLLCARGRGGTGGGGYRGGPL